MSYCRSSDGDSNVYVFGGIDGWEIHVQASERVCRRKTHVKALSDPINWRPFPHKRAGQSFMCETRQETLDTLLRLRGEGLRVPNRALDRLRTEIAEEA